MGSECRFSMPACLCETTTCTLPLPRRRKASNLKRQAAIGGIGALLAGIVGQSNWVFNGTPVSTGRRTVWTRGANFRTGRWAADDMDGVVLIPMDEDDDLSIDDMSVLPEVEPAIAEEKQQEQPKYPPLDGLTTAKTETPKYPPLDGFNAKDDTSSQSPGGLVSLRGDGATSSQPKAKRWLKGRGSVKRRKLDENAALKDWLSDNNVWVSEKADWGKMSSPVNMAVETRETAENELSGRGLVARRDIELYEELARVPYDILLTEESARAHFGEGCISKDFGAYGCIALQMIWEKFVAKENSRFAPYMAVLPSTAEIGASFSWSDEELETLLDGSPVKAMSIFLREKVLSDLRTAKESFMQDFPDKFPADAFTEENWIWAFSNLFSRAVRLAFPDDKKEFVALVPYIDLFNHNPNANTYITAVCQAGNTALSFALDEKERSVLVLADRYYDKYDQIYISYGAKSNGQLLLLYGFSTERNAKDFVEIPVGQLLDSAWMGEAKKKRLAELGLESNAYPLFRDRFTQEMRTFMRLATLEPEDLGLDEDDEFDEVVKALAKVDISTASEELSERKALVCLRGIVKSAMDGYPTTLDEDEALLKDRAMFELLPRNQRNALRVRYGEKSIFRASLATIDRIMNNLGSLTDFKVKEAKRKAQDLNSPFGRLGVDFNEAGIKAKNLEELMAELDV
eukprot:TRINITY_DN102722_c0_g1_i1.p1 TRINITY_DN102722_c0_g1~~TRINITY_DN102722_c0_g1_i1.p1  ORF type:complete len:686 (+),score=137.47 TRINITY_DN102722_c0_g1_i1:53-2110(+)